MQTHRSREPASLALLRRTFASVAGHVSVLSRAETSEVHEQVCNVVRDLKAAGELPERVIVIIRHAARDEKIDGAGDGLLNDVVKWCIAEYFGAD